MIDGFFKAYNNLLLIGLSVNLLKRRDLIGISFLVCLFGLFFFSNLGDIHDKIAERTPLLPLLILGIKPVARAFDTEHVVATGHFQVLPPLLISLHANLAIVDIHLLLVFVVSDEIQNVEDVLEVNGLELCQLHLQSFDLVHLIGISLFH